MKIMELELSNPDLFGGIGLDKPSKKSGIKDAATSLKVNKDTKKIDTEKYQKITQLDITNNRHIKDVSMFKNLKVLYADDSVVSNISGLNLEILHIANNEKITTINIPTLRELKISGTKSVTNIVNAPKLEVLIAYANNKITNQTISNLVNLRELDISYTRVTEVSHLHNLERLIADGDVNIISFPESLQYLSWRNNPNDIDDEDIDRIPDIDIE